MTTQPRPDHTHPAVAALVTLGAPLPAAVAVVAAHDDRDPPRSAADVAHAAGLPGRRPPAWCRRVAAAIMLGRQWIRPSPWRPAAGTPTAAAEAIRPYLAHEPAEVFAMAMLDARNRVIGVEVIHRGTLTGVHVHPREVFRPAIRCGAHAVIVAHNHPSGDPTPSNADLELAQRLADVGQMVGIPMVDALVITTDQWSSMLQLGLLG